MKTALITGCNRGLGAGSRKTLWTKVEKSGNIQDIEKIYLDCDSDTILFLVKQKGVACHRNKKTCFEV